MIRNERNERNERNISMNIQSLSIVVPTKKCVNSCPFCVSRMHETDKEILSNIDYVAIAKRLEFARDNGCNTMMITGTAEPLQNRPFLEVLFMLNRSVLSSFKWIELQTTGVYMDDKNLEWLKSNGVETIALSLINPFDDDENCKYMPEKFKFKLDNLCKNIKLAGMHLRLCLNMTQSIYKGAEKFFDRAKELKVDQLTFRQLYFQEDPSPETEWVLNNAIHTDWFKDLNLFIKLNGRALEILPFGATKYSVHGISTVIDEDCMSSQELKQQIRYLILREGKLYTKWNDLGSLVF